MAEVIEGYNCPHCGAPLKAQPGELIVVCEYCSSTVGLKAGEKYFLSHSILPARYDARAAEAAIRAWFKDSVFLPSDLHSKAVFTELECVYLPFFVFDVKATTRFRGTQYSGPNSVPREDRLEKRYPWKVIARRGSKFPTMEYKIPLSGKVPFNMSHMIKGAKFLNAEVDEVEATEQARSEINEHQHKLVASFMDEVLSEDTIVEFQSTEFVHAPVWRASYDYRAKAYRLYADACTLAIIKSQAPSPDTSLKGAIKEMTHAFFDD